MPIKGSFRDDKSLDQKNIKAMCRATAEESGAALHDEVSKRTPVDTGELRESIVSGPVTQPYPTHYRVKIETDLSYARPIEYGFAPFKIDANTAEALLFNGRYAEYVHHPGYEGAFMFTRGAASFRAGGAEKIAQKNMRKYLT